MPGETRATVSRARRFGVIAAVLSVLLAWIAVEAAARAWGGEYSPTNFVARDLDLFRSAYPATFDARLGWVPTPGYSGRTNIWGTQVTIRDHGVRSNGTDPAPDGGGGPILATGDSFTFGDQVSDAETWPAELERLTGVPVTNAGVFGYGFDQSVLRAEQLADVFHPSAIIVGLIADDIRRCEDTRRGYTSKPFFRARGGDLELDATPVAPPDDRAVRLGTARRVLGYSYAAHLLLRRLRPAWWVAGVAESGESDRSGEDGLTIACALEGRLAALAVRTNRPVWVLALYESDLGDSDLERMARVLDCGRRAGLRVIDLAPALLSRRREDAAAFAGLFRDHMSPAGNRFVAREVAAALAGCPTSKC